MFLCIVVNRDWIEDRDKAGGCDVVVDVVTTRVASRPQDNVIGIWVARSHPVGEVEVAWLERGAGIISFRNLAD